MQASKQRSTRAGSVIVEAVAQASPKPPTKPGGSGADPQPLDPPATAGTEGPVTVRFSALARGGFFGPDGEDPRLLAEIRHLKRSILKTAFGALAEARSNVLAITSALPEAGKTYLAASLSQALTLERDRSALLVDGDDVRRTITKSLEQHGRKGLFDVLHDESLDPREFVLPTDMAGLSFLPVGGRFPDSNELLTSRRALDVIESLSRADPNRLVIIDCPPLLGSPNGTALASLAGQTLVVVEAGVTDADTLTRALDLLGRDRPVALVMNKVPRSGLLSSRAGNYYYYGSRD